MSEVPVRPGDVILGRYRVERVLGAGKMGVVVSAMHVWLDQRVAIKFMIPGAAPAEQYQRFLREARAGARLRSPHAVRVIDLGTGEGGAPYLVMEHLEGRDLAAELRARGPLPFDEAVGYVLQACEAVAEAHALGIVHRDLKPSNMFLTRSADGAPCVKLLDFGISKTPDSIALTANQQSLGSPLYMPPEQLGSAKDVDARADLWSLGASLYELVAGKTPFDASSMIELCTRVLMKPPTPLATYRSDAPGGFEAVLFQCLEKDRARRFGSVGELAAALAPYAPARALPSLERIGGVLGEEAVPMRRTEVLRLEDLTAPAAAPVEAGPGSAVVAPRRRGAMVGVALGALALAALALATGGLVGWALVAGRSPAGAAVPPPAGAAVTPPAGAAVTPPRYPAVDAGAPPPLASARPSPKNGAAPRP
jgi:serine/threonine-protein kinase